MKTHDIIQQIKQDFHETDDLIVRELPVDGADCCFFYLDALSDKMLLEQDIIGPLRTAKLFDTRQDTEQYTVYEGEDKTLYESEGKDENPDKINCDDLLNTLLKTVKFCENIPILDIEKAREKIASGDIAFFVDGTDGFFIFSIRNFEKRTISEPPTSTVIKGPREGFIEEIKTNVSMIRRRIKSTELVVKNMQVGRYSSTNIAVVYINGIVSMDIVKEVQTRLEAINIDGIIDSAYISAFLETRKYSIFNQVGNSEKPDVIAAKLLEGRVAIVVEGSPIVLTVPFMFTEDLQDGYDYYSSDWRAIMSRIFRVAGALITILLPAAYVALQSYHYHLLPLKFLITLVSATNNISFPPAIEMLVVLLLFEILNEASMRMPRYLGVSLSIVGAIVLGDTAVKAGLISSPTVLVTALSAIGVFCIPDQVGTLSVLRFVFLCISAVFGFFGITVAFLCLIVYMSSISIFGTPYLAPYSPRIAPDLKDALLMNSISDMKTRPFSIKTQNRTRQGAFNLRNDGEDEEGSKSEDQNCDSDEKTSAAQQSSYDGGSGMSSDSGFSSYTSTSGTDAENGSGTQSGTSGESDQNKEGDE